MLESLKCSYLNGIHQLSWDEKVKHKNGGAFTSGNTLKMKHSSSPPWSWLYFSNVHPLCVTWHVISCSRRKHCWEASHELVTLENWKLSNTLLKNWCTKTQNVMVEDILTKGPFY
jgi:hypothetical protein